jgi:hypothetical protein
VQLRLPHPPYDSLSAIKRIFGDHWILMVFVR